MKTIKTLVMTKKRNQFEISLPAKRVVCPRCEGAGKQDHPAFSNGVDGLEDPDFRESYFRGDYDVNCEHCNGENVVLELDYEALSPKMLERVYRQEDQSYRDEQESAGERRWGA